MKRKTVVKMLVLCCALGTVGCNVAGVENPIVSGIDNLAEEITQAITPTPSEQPTSEQPMAEQLSAEQLSAEQQFVVSPPAEQPGQTEAPGFNSKGELSVHFIDVGQGDSILISFDGENGKEYAMIDCGDNDKGTKVQKYLMDEGVDKLKYLILTHPDADHIGGADVIISKFDIDNIYMSAATKDTRTYEDVINAINYRSMKWETPEAGTVFYLGEARMEVMAAPSEYADVNNDSIVIKATYGDSSFLFMGDAEFEEEEELLSKFEAYDLDVDVLKAGHHGSYTSSSNEFIGEVTPQWTVICCGIENQYGHPHNTSLYNFADYESGLYRTDIQGTVICSTDGTEYLWDKAPTRNWKSGNEITEDDIEYDEFEYDEYER